MLLLGIIVFTLIMITAMIVTWWADPISADKSGAERYMEYVIWFLRSVAFIAIILGCIWMLWMYFTGQV